MKVRKMRNFEFGGIKFEPGKLVFGVIVDIKHLGGPITVLGATITTVTIHFPMLTITFTIPTSTIHSPI
jgi:hypothetical protein